MSVEEDSTTYQYILEQGALKAARRFVLKRGARRFGEPTENVTVAIQALEDLPRLERMVDCIDDTATSWDEVLDTR